MPPDESIPRTLSRIVLVGFMGAGKSTAGPILAARLGWRFIDADHHLQSRTGSTIAELFSNHGEATFRQMEAEVVSELHRDNELVLALGGGAIETESTRALLSESSGSCIVFLHAPLDVLVERCERQPDAAIRPVLRQRETLRSRYFSRLPHYERAHITVNTEGLAPEEVVERILNELAEDPINTTWTLKTKAIAT